MSTELADLNFRLSKTELEAAEASENLVKCRERESEQRDRLQQLQKQCDDARSEQQKASAALAVSCVCFICLRILFMEISLLSLP